MLRSLSRATSRSLSPLSSFFPRFQAMLDPTERSFGAKVISLAQSKLSDFREPSPALNSPQRRCAGRYPTLSLLSSARRGGIRDLTIMSAVKLARSLARLRNRPSPLSHAVSFDLCCASGRLCLAFFKVTGRRLSTISLSIRIIVLRSRGRERNLERNFLSFLINK